MIPRSALLLGLAGLIPFFWGAATLFSGTLVEFGISNLGPRFVAPFLLLSYGQIILVFMAGALWGFASSGDERVLPLGLALSIVPVLWVMFAAGNGPTEAATYLIAGFLGILGIDWTFSRYQLVPDWWMKLRILLTTPVVLCLLFLVI